MTKKILFIFCVLFLNTMHSQTNSEKRKLIGDWKVYDLSYGEYYTYYLEKDSLAVGSKLQELMFQDKDRYNASFLDKIKIACKNYAKTCTFSIKNNQQYSLTMGEIAENHGFEFLPTQIPISSETTEEDIRFNLDYVDTYALLKMSKDNRRSINEYSDGFDITFFLKELYSFTGASPAISFFLKK